MAVALIAEQDLILGAGTGTKNTFFLKDCLSENSVVFHFTVEKSVCSETCLN
jgi:hypothetical protein